MYPSRLLLLSLLATGPAVAAENVAIVLDASGSMWGQIDGRSKIEIAREAVAGIVASLAVVLYGIPANAAVGSSEAAVNDLFADMNTLIITVLAVGMFLLTGSILAVTVGQRWVRKSVKQS